MTRSALPATDATGGNPFMLRELLTELASEGSAGTAR